MRRLLIGLCWVALGAAVAAEDFGPRFDEGYELLREGKPDEALAAFQELLTDTPESELVQYSIATAQYEKALRALGSGETDAGMQGLGDARSQFDALRGAAAPFVRRNAGFGAANAMTQTARHMDMRQQYKERLAALQTAVGEYTAIVDRYPDHGPAQKNLNHARYLLKRMLQNPPPDPPQSEDGEGEDEGEQGQQDQQGEQGEDGEQDPSDEGEEGEEETDGESETPPPEGGDPQDNANTGQPLQDQNIEAILESLEDRNREEQENLRRAKGAPRVQDGKWW